MERGRERPPSMLVSVRLHKDRVLCRVCLMSNLASANRHEICLMFDVRCQIYRRQICAKWLDIVLSMFVAFECAGVCVTLAIQAAENDGGEGIQKERGGNGGGAERKGKTRI